MSPLFYPCCVMLCKDIDKSLMSNLDDFSKVTSADVVVRLHENFSEATLTHWIVLGVEFVKSVKSVTVLHRVR